MEPFTLITEAIIDEDEYFIFDDVSSSSLEDNDASYVDSEGEEQLQQQATTVTPTQSLFTPNTVSSLFAQEQQQFVNKASLVAYLKPAKGRDDHYTVGDFPASLLCNPYKYDLKLIGEINPGRLNSPATAAKSISDLLNQQRAIKDEAEFLVVTLVDADTMTAPVVCTNTVSVNNAAMQSPMKKGNVSVESITQVSSQERIIRFTFNLCSFHVKRRAFRLVVTNKNTGDNVFVSSPFKTFARKRERNGSSSNNNSQTQQMPKVVPVAANASMYFMNQTSAKKKSARSTLASVRATPYPVVNFSKMTRYSPTEVVPEMQAPQYAQVPVYATYPMYPQTAGFHTGYTYPIENLLQNLGPQERTSLAIQLMSSLTPVERETVDFYLSCSGQCFTMNNNNGGAVKPEDVNACFIASQPHVNSRV